jgi:hypothetical protein
MKTIDVSSLSSPRRPHPGRPHRWRAIGAHTLHAGHKPKGVMPYPDQRIPIREVRKVFACIAGHELHPCKEVRVKLSRHLSLGVQPKKTTPK